MSRWKAFGIHFTLSLLIIGTICALVVWRWYPPGLFQMAKADKLLITLALVDVVIGPLLTLIVFKAGKKGLKFDLSMIALLQIGALAYGLHILWQSRPVYLVGVVDRFELVFANELDPQDVVNADPKYNRLPWAGPRLIGVQMPTSSGDRLKAIELGLAGKDLHQLPAYYADYAASQSPLREKAEPVDKLMSESTPEAQNRLQAAVVTSGLTTEQLRTLPIISARGRATMLIRAEDGAVIGPVAVDPWPDLED